MTDQPTSVIVVSRHRKAALMRCITALLQQDHTQFELIIVADPEAIALTKTLHLPLKRITFDDANISAARNAGLVKASGAVIAFIDDDAAAEPTWLSRLTAVFADPKIVASTGFVRGRNGISYQWQACEVDDLGQDHPLHIAATCSHQGTPKRAVKTQGTNCAFRRDALLQVGGFDPAYRFYLDEADVNLRLAALGPTAIVPDAQVHHGYEASERRSANRVPLSLHEIAASTAVFLRRHAPDADFGAALTMLSRRESLRLTGFRKTGQLNAQAELALLHSLAQGWADGLARPLSALKPLAATPKPAQFLRTGPRSGMVLAGRPWQKRRLIAEAATNKTHVSTVFILSPTAKPHKMAYQPEGFWLQTGGIFGQSTRDGPRLRFSSFRRRIAEESLRVGQFRPVS